MQRQEPDFLDLNASQTEGSSNADSIQLNTTRNSTTDFLHPDNITTPGLSVIRQLDVESSAPDIVMSELNHEDNPIADSLQVNAATTGDLTESSLPYMSSLSKDQGGIGFEADAGDDVLSHVDAREAQPPKVTYHHGQSCPYAAFVVLIRS